MTMTTNTEKYWMEEVGSRNIDKAVNDPIRHYELCVGASGPGRLPAKICDHRTRTACITVVPNKKPGGFSLDDQLLPHSSVCRHPNYGSLFPCRPYQSLKTRAMMWLGKLDRFPLRKAKLLFVSWSRHQSYWSSIAFQRANS